MLFDYLFVVLTATFRTGFQSLLIVPSLSFFALERGGFGADAFLPPSRDSALSFNRCLNDVPSTVAEEFGQTASTIPDRFHTSANQKRIPKSKHNSTNLLSNEKTGFTNNIRTRGSVSEIIPTASNFLESDLSLPVKTSSKIPISRSIQGEYGIRAHRIFSSKERKSSKRQTSNVFEPKNSKNAIQSKPWEASYFTSLKSQNLIKSSAFNERESSPIKRATNVLSTFLQISPEKCNAANLVCALTLSAKLMSRETNDEFRSLFFRTIDILARLLEGNRLSARQLCNTAWAIAKHFDRDPQVLPADPSRTHLSQENVMGHAETWDLRYDVAGCPARRVDKTVDEIANQLSEMLEQNLWAAKESELCMASWAYGILRRRRRPAGWQFGPQLSRVHIGVNINDNIASGKRSSDDLIRFEQWDLTTTNALGTLSDNQTTTSKDYCSLSPTAKLLDKVAEALCEPVISSTFSSSINPMSKVQVKRIQSCEWSELANLAWAFASHGHSSSLSSHSLLISIGNEASRRLEECVLKGKSVLSRDIAQVIWSLGTLQSDSFQLAESLVRLVDAVSLYTRVDTISESDRPLKGFSCADIVQIASSLAHARLDELPLLRSLYSEASFRLELAGDGNSATIQTSRSGFFIWEISVLLWAQARLYLKFPEENVFSVFASKAVGIVNKAVSEQSSFDKVGLGAQEQANIAWSLSVLEQYSSDAKDLLESIFIEASSSCEKNGVIQLEHAHQLWQALCLLEDDYPECTAHVPYWFRLYLEDKWLFEKSRLKVSSSRHRSLSKTLNLMGVRHFNEHDEDIDVAIVLKSRANWTHEADTETQVDANGFKIAVEFDGPNHFTRQRIPEDGSKPEPPRALGHTVLKYRLLKKQGWTVVRVPYYEYDKIPFWASMERQRYLQRLLKTHCNLQFSTADVSTYKPQQPVRKSRYD